MNSDKISRIGIFRGVGDLSFSGSATVTPGSVAASSSGGGGSSSPIADPCVNGCFSQAMSKDPLGVGMNPLPVMAACQAACVPPANPIDLAALASLVGNKISLATRMVARPSASKTSIVLPPGNKTSIVLPPGNKTSIVLPPGNKAAPAPSSGLLASTAFLPGATLAETAPPPQGQVQESSNTVYYVVGGLVVAGLLAYVLTRKG